MQLLSELGTAARSLRRSPGYAAAFILTLGLGIGINAAIFSVVDGVLLSPLPHADADRILYLKQPARGAGVDNVTFSFIEIDDYRAQSTLVDELVEYGDWTFSVVGEGEPHRAVGGLVTPNYFEVLGLMPALGRSLLDEDAEQGAEPVMVLTHDYWNRGFGADPDALGRTIQLGGRTTRIVGVLEPGSHYTGTRRVDFFVNYATNDHYQGAAMRDSRTHRMTDVFARMVPGATPEAARSELTGIMRRLHQEYADAYPADLQYGIEVTLWKDELTRDARSTFVLLMATVGLVLILACANVANLTLTRLIRKEHELATRAALGATTSVLRQRLLAENLVLSVLGAGLGLALAYLGLDLLVDYAGRLTVRTGEIGIDLGVLSFAVAVATGISVVLAWLPGMPLAPRAGGIGTGVRTTATVSRKRLQQALVVSQLSLSFALLIGAGLLVRSLLRLQSVDAGFDPENVVTLESPDFFSSATGLTVEERRALWADVIDRVERFPGVRTASVASWAPLSPNGFGPVNWEFRVEGREDAMAGSRSEARFNVVSPAYFQTMAIPLLAGRTFVMTDEAEGEPVAVLNQSMARQFFPDTDAVGQRISWRFGNGDFNPWYRVVGVVGDTRDYGLDRSGLGVLYVSMSQNAPGSTLMVRTTGAVGPLAQFVKEAIREHDPDRIVDNIASLEALKADSIAPERLNATLFGAFALLALLIAAVGVLGVLAFSVSQRTREFGIRLAVGADRGRVLRMVLSEGLLLVGTALLVGGLGALFLSNFLAGLLYEIEPADPLSFAVAGIVLASVAVLAAYLPARRATRVNPVEALRAE
jgi:predicted permease